MTKETLKMFQKIAGNIGNLCMYGKAKRRIISAEILSYGPRIGLKSDKRKSTYFVYKEDFKKITQSGINVSLNTIRNLIKDFKEEENGNKN